MCGQKRGVTNGFQFEWDTLDPSIGIKLFRTVAEHERVRKIRVAVECVGSAGILVGLRGGARRVLVLRFLPMAQRAHPAERETSSLVARREPPQRQLWTKKRS